MDDYPKPLFPRDNGLRSKRHGDPLRLKRVRYPEHTKLGAVHVKSQAIGEFLEFSGYTLCEWHESSGELLGARGSTQEILAAYFGIDLDALEAEKRAMLDELRAA